MDFLTGQRRIFTSERYSSIYDYFRENYGVKTAELFLICATIGFQKNKKVKRIGEGSEFRSNYFTTKQRAAVYTIILSDSEIGKNIQKFEDTDFHLLAAKTLEDYAEGGMETLVKEVFLQKWDGIKLDISYKEYEVDILSYIYNITSEIPF